MSIPVFFQEVTDSRGVPVRPMEQQSVLSLNFYNSNSFLFVGAFEQISTADPLYKPYSRAFGLSYFRSGMQATIGYPQSEVYYHPNRVVNDASPLVQDFQVSSNPGPVTLVLSKLPNPLPGMSANLEEYFAYPVQGRIRTAWLLSYSSVGLPVDYEYHWTDAGGIVYAVQWFYNKNWGIYSGITIGLSSGVTSYIERTHPSFTFAELGKNAGALAYSGSDNAQGGMVGTVAGKRLRPSFSEVRGRQFFNLQGKVLRPATTSLSGSTCLLITREGKMLSRVLLRY